MKKIMFFPENHTQSQRYESNKDDLSNDFKNIDSHVVTETLVWKICSYQVPVIVGNKYSITYKHEFYNAMIHTISLWGGGGGLC